MDHLNVGRWVNLTHLNDSGWAFAHPGETLGTDGKTYAAKEDVKHGEWLPMLKEIGIDQATARMLMQIGRNPAISNRCNSNDFPAAVRALYELSRMDPEDIEDGIQHGHITPDMTIRQAGSR